MPFASREAENAYRRARYRADLETSRRKQRERTRRWYAEHPDRRRSHVLKTRYGISAEQYDAALVSQGGVCAICGDACPTGKRLAVDHDHTTGQLRGLLCRSCNGAIGALGDDPDRMRRAAAYVEQWANAAPFIWKIAA